MTLPSPIPLLPFDFASFASAPALTQEGSTAPAGDLPAGDAPAAGGGGLLGGMMVPMLVVFAIFYFVMIGPERKARKKREAMLSAIKKGDPVITNGGMHGTVAALNEDTVTVQIDEGVRVKFSRSAIQAVVGAEAPRARPRDPGAWCRRRSR